jgi:hypothetical protein
MSASRPNSPDFDQWRKELVSQAIEHRHAVWSIGDLLLEGEEKFGADRVWSAAEATGMTFDTLRNYKSLANCFPKGRRRLNLGVSHHEAVRSLDEAAREAALDLVQKHDVSRESLRERVKAYNGGDLAALNPDWKPAPKVVQVEDDHAARDTDEDGAPVFDSSDAGEAMAAEKREAFAEQDLNDANQVLLNALTAVDRATAYNNIAHLNRDRVPLKHVLSCIVALEQLLPSAQRYHSAGATPSPSPADKGRAHPPMAPAPAPISSPEDSADDGSHPSIPSSDDTASGPLTNISAQSEHEPGGEKRTPSPPSAPSYEEPDLPPFLDRRHG